MAWESIRLDEEPGAHLDACAVLDRALEDAHHDFLLVGGEGVETHCCDCGIV